MHNGFVNIDQEKMSKSLGNFFTIRDVLPAVHPEVLRFFLLSHHYRSPVDYSDVSVREAAAGLDRLYAVLQRVDEALEGRDAPAQVPVRRALQRRPGDPRGRARTVLRVREAMNDDFNTAEALGHLHRAPGRWGRTCTRASSRSARCLAVLALRGGTACESSGGVLGLLQETPRRTSGRRRRGPGAGGPRRAAIEAKIAERIAARADQGLVEADPCGTNWPSSGLS